MTIKPTFYVLIITLTFALNGSARMSLKVNPIQTLTASQSPNDTLKGHKWFPKSYGNRKWRPMLVLDIKRGVFSDWDVSTYGIRMGAEHKGVQTFNIGYYTLASSGFPFPSPNIQDPLYIEPSDTVYRGGYLSVYYDRAIYRGNKFVLSIPMYLGLGKLGRFEIDQTTQERSLIMSSPLAIGAVGIEAQYYILHWFGPRITFGYRTTLNNNLENKNIYNSLYLGLSARLLWSDIFHFVFKPKLRPERN